MTIAVLAPLLGIGFFVFGLTLNQYLARQQQLHWAGHEITAQAISKIVKNSDPKNRDAELLEALDRFPSSKQMIFTREGELISSSTQSKNLDNSIAKDPRMFTSGQATSTEWVNSYQENASKLFGNITGVSLRNFLTSPEGMLLNRSKLGDGNHILLSLTKVSMWDGISLFWVMTMALSCVAFASSIFWWRIFNYVSRKLENYSENRAQQSAVMKKTLLPPPPKRQPVLKSSVQARPPLPPQALLQKKNFASPLQGRALVKITDALGRKSWAEVDTAKVSTDSMLTASVHPAARAPKARDLIAAKSLKEIAEL